MKTCPWLKNDGELIRCFMGVVGQRSDRIKKDARIREFRIKKGLPAEPPKIKGFLSEEVIAKMKRDTIAMRKRKLDR